MFSLINTVSSFSNGFIYLHTQHKGVTGVPHPHLYSVFLVFLILEFKWEQNSTMINHCGLIFEYILLLLLAILVLSFVKCLPITFPHLKTGLLYDFFLNDLKNIFWIWIFCYLHVLQSSSSTPTLQHLLNNFGWTEDFKKSNCSNFSDSLYVVSPVWKTALYHVIFQNLTPLNFHIQV